MNNELHNYIIDNMNDNSIYSYDSINHIIFDTNYFEFDFNIKKILYKNIVNLILIDWNNNHLYSYYDIINKLIEVYDLRGGILALDKLNIDFGSLDD